jgi:pyruvate dehydrogenase E1 component alpha subunit
VAHWKSRDPIPAFQATLVDQNIITDGDAEALTEKVRARIDEAVEFAEASPEPDPSVLLEDVYTEASA